MIKNELSENGPSSRRNTILRGMKKRRFVKLTLYRKSETELHVEFHCYAMREANLSLFSQVPHSSGF